MIDVHSAQSVSAAAPPAKSRTSLALDEMAMLAESIILASEQHQNAAASPRLRPRAPTFPGRQDTLEETFSPPRRPAMLHNFTAPPSPSRASSLPQDSVLPVHSVLRPSVMDTSVSASAQTETSPTKKLVRKQSGSRLRKDGSGHSRSLSLPRSSAQRAARQILAVPASHGESSGSSASDHEDPVSRPSWLDQDPTVQPSSGLMTDRRQSEEEAPVKTAFYRRKRSQTGASAATFDESTGFPMPSPLSEVVKSMPLQPGATASPRRSGSSSGFLSSITRKLSATALHHTFGSSASRQEQAAPPPLPTDSDYFGGPISSVSSPQKSMQDDRDGLPWVAPTSTMPIKTRDARSNSIRTRHESAAPPINCAFTDPFTSTALQPSPTDPAALYSFPARTTRSSSAPSPLRAPPRSSSSSELKRQVSRTPVPPLPLQYQNSREADADLLVISQPASMQSSPVTERRAASAAEQGRRPSVTSRSLATGSPRSSPPNSTRPSQASLPHLGSPTPPVPSPLVSHSSTPLGRKRSIVRRNETPADNGLPELDPSTVAMFREEDRENRFLELLTKSDRSQHGVIKLSLTPKAAQTSTP